VRWVRRGDPNAELAARELAAALQLPETLARVLAARGIGSADEAGRFFHPTFDQLHSPFEMTGMAVAVERLERAIAQREPMLIYGDYDVDGTVATVILKTAVELLGGVCDFHVPHRLLEGYGMRDEVIERAAANGVRLIISVDTGIRAFAAAQTAESAGLDLIVTDHHLVAPGEGVPKALAVLNPNQPECSYPCKSLCGAGVAFKLAQALLERGGRGRLVPSFLKITALATIADAVPLLGENRVIVKLGLDGLHTVKNAGLRALMEVCELGEGFEREIGATEVAFRIAPRINAAGRMDVARDVVELFTVKDEARARELARRLNELNAARQQEEQRICAEVIEQVEKSEELRNSPCLVIEGAGWHRGVIGICASRVVDRFARPAVVISRDGDEAYGSGRSIAGFHLLDALESAKELFSRYGGHAHAVGFALPSARVAELRRRLNEYAAERLTIEALQPVVEYDGELGMDEITPRLWEQLHAMEPFGMGNPEPVFLARGALLMEEPRVLQEKHLKLKLRRYESGRSDGRARLARGIDALGWRMAPRLAEQPLASGGRVDLLFRVEKNRHPDFGGGLQLVLSDFRLAEEDEQGEAVRSAANGIG
jgi:single-stranded-DNA-specific exonuclease